MTSTTPCARPRWHWGWSLPEWSAPVLAPPLVCFYHLLYRLPAPVVLLTAGHVVSVAPHLTCHGAGRALRYSDAGRTRPSTGPNGKRLVIRHADLAPAPGRAVRLRALRHAHTNARPNSCPAEPDSGTHTHGRGAYRHVPRPGHGHSHAGAERHRAAGGLSHRSAIADRAASVRHHRPAAGRADDRARSRPRRPRPGRAL